MNAQTVYSVPADSRGNRLTLTIANESKTSPAEGLVVRAVRHQPCLTFASDAQTLKAIGASKETDVTFTFDVGRNARLNEKDTQ